MTDDSGVELMMQRLLEQAPPVDDSPIEVAMRDKLTADALQPPVDLVFFD